MAFFQNAQGQLLPKKRTLICWITAHREYMLLRKILPLTRLILLSACLLATTEESVIEIATASGFDNVPYFNRTFKKHIGMTPLEYRSNANK